MNSKLLLAGIVIVVLVAIGSLQLANITGYIPSVGGSQQVLVVIDDGSKASTYNVVLNQRETAFDALKRVAIPDYDMREPSVFITEINGVKQDQDHRWIYFINDKMSQVGCDFYYPVSGDVIKFKYMTNEEIGKVLS